MSNQVNFLDKGYVRLVDHMGSDLSVSNAARSSYEKESLEFSEADARLIDFLVREDHTSPLRHAFVTIECKAPLMIARQWFKYVVGSDHTMDSWNEASRRYITSEPEFYVVQPDEWRSAPENSKQGSGPVLDDELGDSFTLALEDHIKESVDLYETAMGNGVCAEQARLFLPAYGLYVTWRWSASLQAVCHFLQQRLADDAQVEIQKAAEAVAELLQPFFPATIDAWLKHNGS
jgi:thymidylate synthase (FAD)